MTVYIYYGYGASITDAQILEFMFSMSLHPHGIAVKRLTETDLNCVHGHWQKDPGIIVFGGGEFTKVKERLSSYGRAAVIDFTAHNSYLGICKGGYAGSAQINFFGKDCKKTSDGFAFFNGIAQGSLPIAPSLYTGKSDSAKVAIFYHEEYKLEFPALYWGGPCFDPAQGSTQKVENLVTLKNSGHDKPLTMGIKVPVGEKGKAVLIGYHPEAIPHHLREWVLKFCENQKDIDRIENEIARHESWEFLLGFACLLDDLEVVKGHSFVCQILKPNEQALEHSGLSYSPSAFKIA